MAVTADAAAGALDTAAAGNAGASGVGFGAGVVSADTLGGLVDVADGETSAVIFAAASASVAALEVESVLVAVFATVKVAEKYIHTREHAHMHINTHMNTLAYIKHMHARKSQTNMHSYVTVSTLNPECMSVAHHSLKLRLWLRLPL